MSRVRRRGWARPSLSAALVALVAAASVGLNTDFRAPPRFDGAGHAVLAEALATGRGYREIDHPDEPRHDNFPPGYPAALAVLFRTYGRSWSAAHALSAGATVAATVAAWCWFRTMYTPDVALALGLALAGNWTWGRTGGSIQSEPLYMLLSQCAVLATVWAGRGGGPGRGTVLGGTLAACFLTRLIGACLALAAGLELLLRKRWSAALTAGLVATLVVLPWLAWMATAQRKTQAEYFVEGRFDDRVERLAVFYIQRLPDQLTGPIVEFGTVFRRSRPLRALVNAWAVVASGILTWGWARCLRSSRRRLAGLIAAVTLAVLLVWPFTEAGRFLIPLVPFALVGAVEGLAPLALWSGCRRPRAYAALAVLGASIPYAVYAVAAGRAEAQRRAYRDFDAACAWIAGQKVPVGPVLTRHPGEVFWLTGRRALEPTSNEPEASAAAIERFGVAFLLIDEDRYARAGKNPLSRFVERYSNRVRRVWSGESGGPAITVYEVR
jgi:hypothetical protein